MEIPFIGGAYLDRSTNLNAQVCQNLYPVVDKQDGKKVLSLRGTPGLTELYEFVGGGEVRGMYPMGDYFYPVCGTSFVKIDSTISATSLGTLSTDVGPVWIVGDGSSLLVVDGTKGYSYKSATFAEVSFPDSFSPSSATYQDGYFIVSRKNTGEFYISTLRDPTAWDALDYANAEGHSDNLKCVYSFNRDLWLLGESTTEVWFNSGAADFPFERYIGGFVNVGCKAAASVASTADRVFFLDNDLRVRSGAGIQTEVISTPQIDYQISELSNWSDARGFCYTQDGHSFYQLTFDTKTLVFDMTTGFWHTRATSVNDTRHPAQCYANYNDYHLVGDYSNGKIYYYDLENYTNDNDYMRARRTGQVLSTNSKRMIFSKLQVDFEGGVGTTVNHSTLGVGQDPEAMLDWSDDGGHTWSNEHWVKIGKIGNYNTRAIWRRLGSSYSRIFRLTISDPVKRIIIGADLEGRTAR